MGEAALFDAPAAEQVAKVAVDVPVAHLDHLFDYQIPESMPDAHPGVRVVVRFSGQLLEGWWVETGPRTTESPLRDLKAVVSPEVILDAKLYRLIRQVADHYAATWWDIARVAVPPRVAKVERQPQREWPTPRCASRPAVLPGFPGGQELLAALAAGQNPRAFWQVPNRHGGPGELPRGLSEAISANLSSGRSSLVLVPTLRGLQAMATHLEAEFGAGSVATLSSELGRSHRYEHYLACLRGQARILVGTQSAAFTPLSNLGLIVVVDDAHPAHRFERHPRAHARSIALIRAAQESCAVLIASHHRSCEVQLLLEQDWLRAVELPAAVMRQLGPAVRVVGQLESRQRTGARARLPSQAFDQLRASLPQGPVLVSVARASYAAGLSCVRCKQRVTCGSCHGPMIQPDRGSLECVLCGKSTHRFECSQCHSTTLFAPLVGAGRTAEELGRAFPGVRVINSSAERIRDDVSDESAIVVATPGGEPQAESGYAAALILDTEATLSRADLRVSEEALRRWSHVVSLVRPAADGGTVLLVGPREEPAVQALLRCDPGWFAARELAERAAAGLPPAVKAVVVSGDPQAVAEFLDNSPFDTAEVLGPSRTRDEPDPEDTVLLRAPLSSAKSLVRQVKQALAIRSARKEPGKLFVDVDPAMEA